MGGASWGYMNVRLLLSVDYPEGMDTSPIRAALLSCGEEGATACVGHALWAQGALAFKRGDVQDVTWEDQRVKRCVLSKRDRICVFLTFPASTSEMCVFS